jgi:hypothetical protein
VGDSQCATWRHVSVHSADGWRESVVSETDGLVFVVDDDAALRESLKNRGERMIDITVLKWLNASNKGLRWPHAPLG